MHEELRAAEATGNTVKVKEIKEVFENEMKFKDSEVFIYFWQSLKRFFSASSGIFPSSIIRT